MADKYKIIGPLYDFLSTIYSGRQIHKCKIAMNDGLKTDDKILFAGVGHGKDAIDAAEKGLKVTVVDLSATMLKNLEKNIKGKQFKHPIRLVHSDILKFDETEEYDQVVANFFLNVFPEDFMVTVMKHLTTLVKPEGSFVVGDFHYPKGNIFTRAFQNAYWYVAVFIFTVFAKNAFHKIYNYPKHMESLGLKVEKTESFNVLFVPSLWSIKAVRKQQNKPQQVDAA
ncbi:class I SAM-dependent methyltransferase [Bermanella marisrubri]|uniref:Methylase involved in ubiquinone/menaquinone biosynthesis n=1 Tax=Bermanella marisrubri TaxID=207949 RepID=Q1MZG7_9GAMM|nr:class I SAM-dependent methyltransferase [Bermanella marisrubri]EAT11299.1 Methylase involved in ubiquinone/menaquinone biosynthesis [Oceanobacter sp. RED65] [Bermanella marisrubri]QIZ85311.1 class I SAM-dependent methyltransferase [Bermanella marisrubri]